MNGERVRRLWVPLMVVIVMAATAACGGSAVPPEAGPTTSSAPTPWSPSPLPPPKPDADKRPNILVIEADDMRSDELRWMPNVRRFVGDKGLTFENSFAPYPLCCPSRASFLTGRYAHNHGVLNHTSPWGFQSFDDTVTLATRLRDSGYETALVGKYLNGYGEQPIRGSSESSLLYVPPGWSAWHAGSDHHWAPGELYDGRLMSGGTYAYYNLTQNIDGKIHNFAGEYSSDVLAGQTRRLIKRFSDAGRPWFIWFTPVAPHFGSPDEPDDPGPSLRLNGGYTHWLTPARPDWVKGRFDSEITHGLGTPPDKDPEADVTDKPSWIRAQPLFSEDERVGVTALTRQRAEALFALDDQIGRTLKALRRTGEYDNTVIAFTSDNGYYLGEHRRRQGKVRVHEPSLRVPFLIAGPGIPHGRRYDPITTVDLAPTFAAMAAAQPLPKADGIDMTPVMLRGDQGWTRPVVTEGLMKAPGMRGRTLGFDSALNLRGIRLGRWKLTEYVDGESELYDLAADPLELENLSEDPAYEEILAAMRELWLKYENCAGAACAAPLPDRWQVGTDDSRRITDDQRRAVRAYYGN